MATSARKGQLSTDLRMGVMRLARCLRHERVSQTPVSRLTALGTLDRYGPMSPGALAEHERVQPPTMTRVIALLEADGLLERAPHPTDRRQQVLAVTPAGHELLVADRKRRDAWLACRLAELTDDERAVIAAAAPILQRMAGG